MAEIMQPIRIRIDIKSGMVIAPQRAPLMQGDKEANRIIAQLYDGDTPADLSGAEATGCFIRADGKEVPLAGRVAGNEAYMTLDERCYAIEGYFEAQLRLIYGGVKRTVLIVSGHVYARSSGPVLDAEEMMPSYDDIIAVYNEMLTASKDVRSATQAAQEAAADAAVAASRAPYIGENGYWYVYNASSGEYAYTGVAAGGSGVTSVNGVRADINGNVAVNAGDARYVPIRNFTDNGFFAAPYLINSRGQNVYDDSSTYCIDRWVLRRTASELRFVDAGARLIVTGTTSNMDGLMQSTDALSQLAGRPVTLAVKVRQNDLGRGVMMLTNSTANNVWGTTIAQKSINGTGIFVLNTTIPPASGLSNPLINIFIGVPGGIAGDNSSLVIEWAALLDGTLTADMLTAMPQRGRAHEELECARYYRRFSAAADRVIGQSVVFRDKTYGTTYAYIDIDTAVTMRIIPTINDAQAAVKIGGATCSSILCTAAENGMVTLRAILSQEIDVGAYPVVLSGLLELSADL